MKVSILESKKISELVAWADKSSSARRRAETAPQFEFTAISDHDRPDVQAAWQRLLESRRGPEQLYQLPAFCRYLTEMAAPGPADCELHVVRRSSDGHIVGIVPGRRSTQKLSVRVGPLALFERKVPVYQVLGSVPLLETGESGLAAFVMRNLLQSNPDCRALLMQAMPEELADTVGGKGLAGYVVNGWQGCHTAPLPETVDEYLQKFSSKKRYNLSRQVRLLAKEAGEVELVRIEQVEQVAALVDGMRKLIDAEELATLPSQAKLEGLARHGLLHAYLLQCAGQTVALVLGTRSPTVWHVAKIYAKQEYMSLSIGTSIIHLAMQDAIEHFDFTHADFGYGTPNHEFRSTHVLQRRGKLLLCRRGSLTHLLFRMHGVQDRMNEAMIARVKSIGKWLKQRRHPVK